MKLAVPLLLLLTGCSWSLPKLKIGANTVVGPKDAGTPAVLNTTNAGTTVPLPAGSIITVTKIPAVLAVPATATTPAQAAQPAKEITTIEPAGPTTYQKTEAAVSASTGTVDTSITMKRIDVQESRILLYAAIGAAIGAGLFVYIKYPTPAICCGVASVVFFLAWKLSDLPPWFYVIGIVAAAGGFFLWRGHEKGEKSAVTP